MKKCFSAAMILCMMLTFIGCDSNSDSSSGTTSASSAVTTAMVTTASVTITTAANKAAATTASGTVTTSAAASDPADTGTFVTNDNELPIITNGNQDSNTVTGENTTAAAVTTANKSAATSGSEAQYTISTDESGAIVLPFIPYEDIK